MIRTNFHLTIVQRKQLQDESSETGLPEAEILRRAVDDYFRRRVTRVLLQKRVRRESQAKRTGGKDGKSKSQK